MRGLAGALDDARRRGRGGGPRQHLPDPRGPQRRHRGGAAARRTARCIWLDTPLAQAQVNLVQRLLERFGSLPHPVELRGLARSEAGVLAPTSQMRAQRELEPPSADEGFVESTQAPFERAPWTGRGGVFVAASALTEQAGSGRSRAQTRMPRTWSSTGAPTEVPRRSGRAARLTGVSRDRLKASSACIRGGPPICWCRPPLPGLPLAFARAQRIDPSRSVVVGSGPPTGRSRRRSAPAMSPSRPAKGRTYCF